MELLVMLLLLVSVCACVYLTFKTFKRVQEIQEDVSRLHMMPRGRENAIDACVTASGMPSDVGAAFDADMVRSRSSENLPVSNDDLAKIVSMVMERQGV